jgi:spore coat polysaccharide biosynthesis protein SpsF
MSNNATIIIPARVNSTRLPNKVMMDLAGEPMLARVIHRASQAKTIDRVIVAIPNKSKDDDLASFCKKEGWLLYRGDEDDVLRRYYEAAMTFKVKVAVRLTQDCPLIDPSIIDKVVTSYYSVDDVDYATNTVVPYRTYPRGLDCEVIKIDALQRAYFEDHSEWREHVTPYIYKNPDKFKIKYVTNDIDYSNLRWTVDTIEDYAFVWHIFNYFKNDTFSWRDVLKVLEENPSWAKLNVDVEQKTI